jgi:serine/threonine protein phosphatase PrpC
MFSLISCASFSLAKYIDKKNEDSILLPLYINDGYLFAVADGVGSYAGAREASHIAIDVLMKLEYQLANNFTSRIDIDLIFKTIKSKISELSNTDVAFKDSATTLTFCYVNQFGIRIGHIGDCRLYLKDDNKLIQITKDHTRHQQLLDAKLYTAKQLKEISGKNVLTTALSKNIEMKYDEYFISIDELIDFKDENNCIVINIMTDGAHNIWEKRPKFSQKTLSSPLAFSSSLLRRIERIGAEDDHSLISVKVQF